MSPASTCYLSCYLLTLSHIRQTCFPDVVGAAGGLCSFEGAAMGAAVSILPACRTSKENHMHGQRLLPHAAV